MEFNLEHKLGEISSNVAVFKDKYSAKLDSLQKQTDAIDLRLKSGGYNFGTQGKSLQDLLKENDSFARLMSDRKGRAVISLKGSDVALMEQKTVISSGAVGYTTPGVLGHDRFPNIVPEAGQALTMRDVLFGADTDQPLIDFVKVSTPMTPASPVPEGSLKPENAVTFSVASERVRTIANLLPASNQVLSDWKELTNFINSNLAYYVDLAEEIEILSGDSTGEHLHGLIPQASNFNAGLLSATAGWNRIDVIGRAMQQIEEAKEITPTFVVLHPRDWWNIRLAKDGFGRYLNGGMQETVKRTVFDGIQVVTTTSIAAGTFLVGSGLSVASQLRTRMETIIEASTEHADFFARNMTMFRAEKRVALVVERPGSYVVGTFTTSPAGQ